MRFLELYLLCGGLFTSMRLTWVVIRRDRFFAVLHVTRPGYFWCGLFAFSPVTVLAWPFLMPLHLWEFYKCERVWGQDK